MRSIDKLGGELLNALLGLATGSALRSRFGSRTPSSGTAANPENLLLSSPAVCLPPFLPRSLSSLLALWGDRGLQLSAATLNYDTMILGPVSQRVVKRPTDQTAIDAFDRLRGVGVASLIESDPREETWTNSVLPTP